MTRYSNKLGSITTDLELPDSVYRTSATYNTDRMAIEVRAALDSRMAHELSRRAAEILVWRTGLSADALAEFIHFLVHDPEISDRFHAYRAAKRIIGDPPRY